MIPISVCIIAKNEEEYIGECLKRLKEQGFELIVVDTGSNDNTKYIASQYTENLYNFVWCKDFSKARNYAASKASNDWILCVDCDEHLQDIDLDALLKKIEENPDGCGMVNIISPSPKSADGLVMETEVMRFYNRKKYRFKGAVHEQIVDENGRIASPYSVPVSFYHYGYSFEGEKRDAKQHRNIELLKKELKKRPDDPYLYFQLGRSYRVLEEYKEAEKYIEKALTLDFDYTLDYGKLLVVDYAQTMIDLGEYEKAMRIELLENLLGDYADYVFKLGQVYYLNKKPVKALQQFIKVMGMEEGLLKGTTNYLAYYMMMRIYHDMGETQMEEYFAQKYRESAPDTQ